MRVVYMGTPDFAVPSLKALVEAGHEVTAVVTRPDKPKGRNKKPAPPPVKEAAEALGLPVLQPERPKEDAFAARMQDLASDVFVVVAYGHILPRRLLDMPGHGAINLHASLLPLYRGPAPVQWAVANCDTRTGVCSMRLDEGMDTGDVLLREAVDISPEETAGMLLARLSVTGAALMVRTLEMLEKGNLPREPQDHSRATYARALVKEDGRLDFTRPARELACQVRGMSPWPGAYTSWKDKPLKIHAARALEGDTGALPGTVAVASGDALYVACGQGLLALEEVQGGSGKRLFTGDFLRGARIAPGDRLG
jgi:methionyl-tRNA formyltransferase